MKLHDFPQNQLLLDRHALASKAVISFHRLLYLNNRSTEEVQEH